MTAAAHLFFKVGKTDCGFCARLLWIRRNDDVGEGACTVPVSRRRE